MARVNLAVDHGQEPEVAQANFERAVTAAQARFGTWMRQVDWSDDRSSVRLVGPGYDVELTYDEQKVYVRGTVPIAFKLMQGPIKSFIAQALADGS
jgi:hypothetical protein